MKCLPIQEYPKIVSSLKLEHSEIDSVIVTSEDPTVIEWIREHLNVEGVNVIFNEYDDSPGTGYYSNFTMNQNDSQTLESFLAIWLSVKLQFNAQYYVINRHSNILHQIWLMADNMDCRWNQGLDVDVDEKKHCIDTAVERAMWSRCYRKKWLRRKS